MLAGEIKWISPLCDGGWLRRGETGNEATVDCGGRLSGGVCGRPIVAELAAGRPSATQSLVLLTTAGVSYPARFALMRVTNPCPCGHLGDPRHECRCASQLVERYRSRISGPLLDRIDMHVEVPALSLQELKGPRPITKLESGAVERGEIPVVEIVPVFEPRARGQPP